MSSFFKKQYNSVDDIKNLSAEQIANLDTKKVSRKNIMNDENFNKLRREQQAAFKILSSFKDYPPPSNKSKQNIIRKGLEENKEVEVLLENEQRLHDAKILHTLSSISVPGAKVPFARGKRTKRRRVVKRGTRVKNRVRR